MKKSEVFESGNILILALLVLTFLIVIFLYSLQPYIDSLSNNNQTANISNNIATRIIDGDTFELSSGEIVRLLCIDAPEKNQSGYEQAKNFLESLILTKQVRLEKDISETDKYNRLLKYVYVNISEKEIFVNKEILTNNYATFFQYGNDSCEMMK